MEDLTMADPQTLLWQHLKDAPQGLEFVRDFEADGFTLPFYCEAAHLAVEIEADPFKSRNDAAREAWQEAYRVDIMQVPPSHVLRNALEVADAILAIAGPRKERFAKQG
jgi:adenine-specific DNA-methyltransferase